LGRQLPFGDLPAVALGKLKKDKRLQGIIRGKLKKKKPPTERTGRFYEERIDLYCGLGGEE